MATTGKLDKSTVLALGAMGVAVLVIANDFTALSVAIPSIENDLHTGLDTAQWVINIYALVFGVLIVTGGRLADMFGRRTTFFLGAAIFAVFSVLGGASPGIGWLLAARALMGIGGAMMWPSILGMTYQVVPKEKAGLAGGLILGAAGFGNAIGPMFGGFLTDAFSWRWIFFVNVPIAALGVAVTWLVIPPDAKAGGERGIDYPGMVALTVGLVSFLVALDEGPTEGWGDPLIIGLFCVGVVSLVAFASLERRAGSGALVPPTVLRNIQFRAAALAVLLMSAIFFAALVYLPQFMQKNLRYAPLEAGAGLLPMMGTFALTSFAAGPLYERVGAKRIVAAGAAALAVGMFLLSRVDSTWDYWSLVPGMVVVGIGVGIFYSSITTAAVTALDPSQASLAGAIVYMFQIAGGAIGLGLNTAIVTSESLVSGIATAFLVDAVLALAGLVVVVLFVGGRAHPGHLVPLRGHYRAHA
ncbi:MAG: DHA2 family efflux MFS transporter permease subunit [Actinomycetota bacterium]|nr:DHA2 family efflux MFS transporter permease subunit [Actinomycetota bacterium]